MELNDDINKLWNELGNERKERVKTPSELEKKLVQAGAGAKKVGKVAGTAFLLTGLSIATLLTQNSCKESGMELVPDPTPPITGPQVPGIEPEPEPEPEPGNEPEPGQEPRNEPEPEPGNEPEPCQEPGNEPEPEPGNEPEPGQEPGNEPEPEPGNEPEPGQEPGNEPEPEPEPGNEPEPGQEPGNEPEPGQEPGNEPKPMLCADAMCVTPDCDETKSCTFEEPDPGWPLEYGPDDLNGTRFPVTVNSDMAIVAFYDRHPNAMDPSLAVGRQATSGGGSYL